MAMRLSSKCCSFLADFPVLSTWQARSMRRLIAVVLLLAGLSKVFAALAGGGVFFNFALAGWELLLSGWLLYGKQSVWSLAAGAFTFSAFVGVSLQRLMLGSQSCDCFGDLKIGPQWTLVGDVVVVVLLVWAIRSICQAVGAPFLIALILFGCSAGIVVDFARSARAPSTR